MNKLLKKIEKDQVQHLPIYFQTMDAIPVSKLDRRAFLVGETTLYDGGYFLSNRHYKPLSRILTKPFSNQDEHKQQSSK